VNQAADDNSGLLGPIIITARGKALPDGRPSDVDTEFVTIYKVRRRMPQCTHTTAVQAAVLAPGADFS